MRHIVVKQAMPSANQRALIEAQPQLASLQTDRYENILIVGATSTLAVAFAHILAKRKVRLFLAARNEEEAQRIGKDLAIRYGCPCTAGLFVAEDYASHKAFFEHVRKTLGAVDGVFVAVGELGDQALNQSNFERAKSVIESNYTGMVSLLTYVGEYCESRKQGYLIAVGSVAGDRGRQSNYVYGSAKAALATYLQGMRHRLSRNGVHVMTVKAGFIDTKMTYGLIKGPLVADTASVAKAIVAALERKRLVVYVPWFWQFIMFIIRAIPEWLFVKTKI